MEITKDQAVALIKGLQEVHSQPITFFKDTKHNIQELESHVNKYAELQFEGVKRFGGIQKANGQFEFEIEKFQEYDKYSKEIGSETIEVDLRKIHESLLDGLKISGIAYDGLAPILIPNE